jgi:hypothetical protein
VSVARLYFDRQQRILSLDQDHSSQRFAASERRAYLHTGQPFAMPQLQRPETEAREAMLVAQAQLQQIQR